MVTRGGGCGGNFKEVKGGSTKEEEQNQLSLVDFLLSAIRKSMVACRVEQGEDMISAVQNLEIGWPTNVRHITHVTFDRFNGFLGLPVEFEVEIPGRVPSASASVFGVSVDSMQLSFDSKGNSVPTILLLMQERLYAQGGLKAEGIFRINPENGQEEIVRGQLNRGIVPDDVDVHCLSGLIKAWFRELPSGVLDGLSPEHVLQCETEEDCVELVKQLKPTEAALLNWAIDLMADVVEEEEFNKMNARNIAMVFAPNMTQMSDPLTALMHAVQVMNLLKTLIKKTLNEREETETGSYSQSPMSSCSSEGQTDEDFDSQQEVESSSEVIKTSPTSDYDENGSSSNNSEDESEVKLLNDIEECLRQLDENKLSTNNLAMLGELTRELQGECFSPQSCSGFNVESATSFTDSKNNDSDSSTSDGEEDSAKSVIAVAQDSDMKNQTSTNEMELVNMSVVSALPMLLAASTESV
ncbi:hypothetical protein ACLB2K_019450 [Fragaria x ananassa]